MSKIGAKVFCLVVVLSLMSIYFPKVIAQTQNTGAIQGRVFEAGTLAPLPGATVTVTHEDIGIERTTVTNSDGIYYVGILPAGKYRISAARQGYENDANPENSILRNFLIHITNTEKADQPPPIALRKIGAATTQPPVTAPPTAKPPVSKPPVSKPPVSQPPASQPPVSQPPVQPPTQPSQQVSPPRESEAELLVNTTNATRGGNFSDLQLLALPLPGIRTFDDLAFLLPGVAPPPQAIGTSVGPGIGPGVGTSGQFSVNGLRSRSNNFTIDGSDNNDEEVGVRRQGFTSLVPQSIESVQEFQISTLLPEPQFGRNMGAQVNAASRSGGSGFHGTVYGFLTDSRLRARDPFDFTGGPATSDLSSNGKPVFLNHGNGTADFITINNPVRGKDPFTRGQYGFVLGGPVIKHKTYVFFSFERQDVNASKESHFAVPTVAERGLFGKGDKGLVVGGIETPPSSLVGNSFQSLFPFPNNPRGPYGDNTFTEVLPASAHGTILSGKFDHNFKLFGRDTSLMGRYNHTDDNTILPVTGEALFSSLRALVKTHNLAFSLNTAVSSSIANQLRFSFGRTSLGFREVRDPFLIPSAGVPNVPFLLNAPLLVNITSPSDPTHVQFLGLPFDTESGFLGASGTGPIGQVKVSGFSPLGVDVFNFPQERTNNTFQYADTLIFNHNKHRFIMGFDTRQLQLNSLLDRNFRPLATFNGEFEFPPSNIVRQQGGTCVDKLVGGCLFLGSDLLAAGAATGFFQTLTNGDADSRIRMRYWQNNFFFSDQIRARSNLTITLGVRYESNTVPTEVDRVIESTFGSAEVLAFANAERQVTGGQSGLNNFLAGRTKIFKQDNNNFAPHIAVAWDPFGDGKTSIRAGYGIYYDQIPGAVISQSRNVFPRFLTINLGGYNTNFNVTNTELSHPLVAVNPSIRFAKPGTLNRFDPASQIFVPGIGIFSGAVGAEEAAALLTNLAAGPGFVLPAADLVTPYSQHWGITIERQLKGDFLASIAYVGTKGVHLLRFATPNLGPNALLDVTALQLDDFNFPSLAGKTLPPTILLQALRPFPLLGSITSIESDANSSYHSLQLQLNKRFSKGLQFTAAYTWSHAIDEVSDLFDLAGARALPQDSFSRSAEKGNAGFDVRHRLVYSLIYDLPFFKKNRLLGGWQLGSIGTFQTGQPYSLLSGIDSNADGNPTDRTDANLSASAGRNIFRAPGIETVDLAMNKDFRFGERHKLEFRTECFNTFNRVNFGIPVHELFFGGLGLTPATQQHFVNTQVPMRNVQFALKYSF